MKLRKRRQPRYRVLDCEQDAQLWLRRMEWNRAMRIGSKHAQTAKFNPVGVCGTCGAVYAGSAVGTRGHMAWHISRMRRMRALTRARRHRRW
jgi:hypothetical protein